ncbi:MAG: hypothetical protein ISP71_01875, partial [Flavobacteriales bacterium]|nr:hypothetical protein [Flavobacteriales bacterium]
TNEIQFLSISNDTLYLSDGNDVYLGAISSDLDQDSTNEWNTAFEIINDSLFITDAGGSFGVPLDSIMASDNDQDSTNEWNTAFEIINDSLFITDAGGSFGVPLDSIMASDNDQDSTNEWNTAFEIINDSLFITDAGGSFGVPLDSIMASDNDQDSTNEWNTAFEIINDSLFITDAGGSFGVPLDSIVNEPWNTVGTTEGHTTNTGDMYYMGNLAVGQNTTTAGKVATFAGDVDVQGVLDPTKLVFSNSAGTNSSFVPSTDGAYEIEFTEGMDLSFKSDATDSILHLENAGNIGVGTASPQAKLHIAGNVRIDDAPVASTSDSVMMLDPNGYIKQIASTSLIITESDGDSTNEIQSLSIANDSLFLTDGGAVDLSPYLEDTLNELQTLSLVNDTLTLSNGNSVVLSPLAISEVDGDTANELQTIDMFSLSGNTVFLSLENDGEAPKQLDLSVLQDGTGTDDQLLSLSGNTLTLEDGGSVDLSTISATEIDGDTMNELNTGFYVASGNLNITDAGGTKSVALSSLQDGTGTDDQNISGSYLFGNQLIIGIEGGLSDTVDLTALNSAEVDGDTLNEIQDIDVLNLTGTTLEISLSEKATSHSVNLAALQDGTGTDTQDLSLIGNILYLTDGGNVDLSTVTTNEVDGDTLNEIQTIDQLSLVGSTLYLSLENDDQTPSTLDLSSLQDGTGTDDQQLTLEGTNLSIEDGNTVDLSSLQDGTGTDDQTVDAFALSGTTLSLSIEGDGVAPNTVDLSSLQDGTGTDTQDLSLIGNTLYLTDGGNVDLSTITTNEVDGDVTNEIQTVDAFALSGTTLNISLSSDGVAPSTVDLSSLQDGTGTDDQQLTFAGTNLTIEDGNTVDLSSLQDGTGTDDQTVDAFALSGTTLSLSLEGDGVVPNTVDLSSLQDGTGTDNQQLTLIGTNLTIEDGNTIDLATITTEVDGDVTNEIQTVDAFALSGTTLNISLSSDGVAPSTVDLSSLQDGTGTDTQDLSLIGNTLYLTDGGNVDLSTITTNEIDGDVTNEIQTVDVFNLSGTTLSISLENDGIAPSTVDLSSLQDGTGTDNQQLTLLGTDLSIEDGNTVDLSSLQDGTGTDDQTVDAFALSGTTLSLSLEGDGVAPNTVDLSSLQDGTGTDDQQLTLIGTNLTIEDGNTVDLATITTEVDGDVTNEIQTVDAFALSGTTLSLSLEGDGVAPSTVDLSSLQDGTGTDDQQLTLIGTNLTIEDGNTVDLATLTTEVDGDVTNEIQTVDAFALSGTTLNLSLSSDGVAPSTVDLSSLQDGIGTDDQQLTLIGTNLTIEDGNTVDLATITTEVDGDTLNEIQTVDAFSLSGTTLSISLEDDGVAPSTVDLSSLQDGTGTDTQDLSLIGNTLYLTDGGNVDLSTITTNEIDGDTMNELNTGFNVSGGNLNIIDAGGTKSIALTALQDGTGTDDQNISGSFLSGTNLTIGIEGGTSETIDLSSLATEVDGDVTNEIQTVDAFSLSGTTLSISLENDNVLPSSVDLSSLQDGTGTDNQQLTLIGTNLTIEDGNTVDLATITTEVDGDVTNEIQTVDAFSLSGTTLSISLENDNVLPSSVDLSSLQDGTGTDTQDLSLIGNTLYLTDGGNVDLSTITTNEVDGDVTNEIQTVDAFALSGTTLSLSLSSDGVAPSTVDLSSLQDGTGTDDQQLTFAGTNLTIEGGNTVDLSPLQDGTGTDDQTVDAFTLSGTTLNLSLENDGVAPNTVDLSSLQDGTGTDDQTIYIDGDSLRIEDGNAVALSSLGTDDQTIDVLTLVGDTMLNISLEDDGVANQTLDLSPLKDADGDAWAVDGEDTTNLARRAGDVQVVGEDVTPTGTVQEIVTNYEAFNNANFAYYNAAIGVDGTAYGSNASLFNNATETGIWSFHSDRTTAGQDWGFGYTFGTSYYITSVRIQAQSSGTGTWNLRTGGGEFRLYNGGTLVYTSSTIAAASGPSAWTTAVVPNIVADEVRYIFPNGANTSRGDDIFNACEFEIVGQTFTTATSTLIFADVSENNFGVGTDSPDTKLHVEGNAKITAMDAGASTDEIVVVDSDGLLKKVSSSSVGSDDQTISIDGDSLRIEDGNAVALSDLSSGSWELGGNAGTTAGTNFVGTTDAQDLVFKTNNVEAARFKSGDQRLLFANPGAFAIPGISSSAVLGIDGTTHSRLRITAGDDESYNDSKGASIDLHGNNATANTGVLDLVAGSAASGTNGAIKFWTNTDGSTQQTSAVLTGAGNFGIGANIVPSQRLDVDGGARVRSLPLGAATDSVVVVDATGVLKKVAQGSATHTIQTLTSSGSVNSDTDVLLVTPGANMTVTIPAIGTGAGEFPEGYELKIKRTSAAGNNITLSPTSSTIDGQATRTLNIGYQSMTLVATSSGWFIID